MAYACACISMHVCMCMYEYGCMRVFACMCSGVRVICIAGTKFMHELFKEANLFVVGQRLYQIYIYIHI